MKNSVFLFFLSLVFFSCKQNGETQKSSERDDYSSIKDTLTRDLQSAFAKNAIIGFSVSVVDDEGLIYENGFGHTDIELTKKYTPSTIQNIASISKTLIGIALLKAQEQGKLKLNDPINQYLPFKITNPHYPDIPILIKHLAHHSSSIIDLDEVYSRSYILKKSVHDDNEGVYDWFNQPESKISMIDFIKNSLTIDGKWYEKATFAQTKPGETTAYSNLGATLCAQIIELATGQDYRSFTQEHILQPLKMTASGWSENDIDTTKRSRLFANKEMLIAEYDLITYPDGGFITSNQDLGLFLTELIKGYKGQGTLLNKERYEKLFERPQLPNPAEGEAFGIFITFSNQFLKMKELVIGHDGSDPGAMTAMYFDPKTEMGKILLINTDSDFDDQFWPEVVSIWKALLKYESAYNKRKASGTN